MLKRRETASVPGRERVASRLMNSIFEVLYLSADPRRTYVGGKRIMHPAADRDVHAGGHGAGGLGTEGEKGRKGPGKGGSVP